MRKNLLKILALTLLMALVLNIGLTSCNKAPEEPDDNVVPDVKPDVPNSGEGEGNDDKKPLPDKEFLNLSENGKANFQIVYNTELASSNLHSAIRTITAAFGKQDVDVETVNSETAENVKDCEIVVGSNIGNREGYDVDTIPLGNDGYIIKVIGNKVIIKGQTERSTITALNWFKDKYLKIKESGTDLKNAKVEKDLDISVKTEFYVTKVAISGNELTSYKIAYDKENAYAQEAAIILHDRIYALAGYWLDYVSIDENPDNAIYINVTEESGTEGFRARVSGNNMYIECALPKILVDSVKNFMNKKLSLVAEGEILFDETLKYTESVRMISYCEYGGAIGDGIHDDFDALKKTHDRANQTGQTVLGDSGKKFNVGAHAQTITIQTDCVWTGVEFIIDDRIITPENDARNHNIFNVSREARSFKVTSIESLSKNQKNVGRKFNQPVLLYIENSNERQYIRYGINQSQGNAMHEVIVVDENGDVDPSTPIMWDYKEITNAYAYAIDDTPITLSGGTFTTLANRAKREYTYYARGFSITRSNVTIRGAKHLIREEGENGAPYSGFYSINSCNNTLIEDCVITGHKTYKREEDERNHMGTYELGGGNANNITWRNVTQTNKITDNRYWGVMGTNYCKNMTYDGCELSRFDAHSGVYNASILNSKIGHQNLSIIGLGTIRVENTEFFGNGSCNTVINLRSDYGSTWDGDAYIKNITVHNSGDITLINGSWVNHYFGYVCHLPGNVYIDGVKLMDNTKRIKVLGNFSSAGRTIDQPMVDGKENKNPYALTENIYIKSNKENNTFIVSDNPIFKNTKIFYE